MEMLKTITELIEMTGDIANYRGHNEGAGQKRSNVRMASTNSDEIPEFVSPYPVRVHHLEAEACKAIRDWVLHHSVDKEFHPDKLSKLLLCPEFAARMLPDSSAKGLELFSKFVMVLYLVDEIMDDTELERSWEVSVSLALDIDKVIISTIPGVQSLTESLHTSFATDRRETIQITYFRDEVYNVKHSHINPCNVYAGKLSAVGSCFRDSWGAIVELMHPDSCLRLARYYQKFLISSLIQIQNRENGVIPSLDEYIPMRRDACAYACCFMFMDLTDGVFLPEDIFSSLQMQGMVNIFLDIMSWCNDLWSFKKECLVNGDVHNLVFLISHYLPCSLQRAQWLVTEMLYAECSKFEAVAEELLKATNAMQEHRHAIWSYIEGCRHCISATYAWHKRSLLYK
ncbi:hypothetical protein O6H91_15G031700 [Diphasiastrum complanatum]|uniref:Uncharacterized protein n=2 Tax=Diphasiastrum complanatum TaxID=34168 RepID=A0ACC2BGW9_DIPCM|nr:hypothetical protein O6H91_15G031400 [Diphasiastrum complanatum]KAJ7529042.1 hypothetical protein O6H91_15G031700 [Diphasiastrum complanatum]